MWKDLSLYIINKSAPGDKIIEIGAGKFLEVSSHIKECSKLNLIVTDIKPFQDWILKEDVFNPNWELYDGVKIIYSIRPPMELHQALMDLAIKINATLIIKPLTDDTINTMPKMRLINYKKTYFYIYND
jgi:hypothetical protein